MTTVPRDSGRQIGCHDDRAIDHRMPWSLWSELGKRAARGPEAGWRHGECHSDNLSFLFGQGTLRDHAAHEVSGSTVSYLQATRPNGLTLFPAPRHRGFRNRTNCFGLVDVLGANLHHRLLALENGRHQSRLADDPGGSTAANAERCAVMNGTWTRPRRRTVEHCRH